MSYPRVHRLWLSIVLSGLALIFVAGCAQNSSSNTGKPDSKPAVDQVDDAGSSSRKDVLIAGSAFQPATVTIKAGTTVLWTNNDAANHQVHADDNAYKSDIMGKGGTVEVSYAAPGTFTYHCHVHSNMRGTIIVE